MMSACHHPHTEEFKYSLRDLSLTVPPPPALREEEGKSWNNDTSPPPPPPSSRFDSLLQKLWEERMEGGLFRYKLRKGALPWKVLDGRFGFVAQLNVERAEKRRKPQEIQSPNQPYNPEQFNFNWVGEGELLMRLRPEWGVVNNNNNNRNNQCRTTDGDQDEHLLLINVSPLEYCNVLLTPFRSRGRPQRVTQEGLRMGVELVLLSGGGDFRVGFNSLCGFASVNHEHWHGYYLSHRLYLESAVLEEVTGAGGGWVKVLKDKAFPPAFVFVLDQLDGGHEGEEGMGRFLDSVMTLVDYVQGCGIPHNLFITRGSSTTTRGDGGTLDCVRVFVWARTSSFIGVGGCCGGAFNPAFCELGGHFPVKDEESFNNLTEEYILSELHGICDEPFSRVLEWVTTNSNKINNANNILTGS